MKREMTYRDVNGYQIPNLTLPEDGLGEEIHIGVWGQRRLDYLKRHKRVLYTNLLITGKLRAHLHEIDIAAHERRERIVKQQMETQGVTGRLKAENKCCGSARPTTFAPARMKSSAMN
jgi:hypothetical protein